jgi:hypothetical protein
MCSATQAGLRVRRSYEDVRDGVGRRSAMGPGKPYWKRPLGSTTGASVMLPVRDGVTGSGRTGIGAGMGEAGEVLLLRTVVVEVTVVDEAIG